MKFMDKTWRLMLSSWNIGVNEPDKFIHCLKVSVALCAVSLFYYIRPLYSSVGGNAMWAVLTVVVVFEYTVGATVSKSVNRAVGTIIGGSLGVGVHWIASLSGQKLEPIILGALIFIFAGAATFSRFIPRVKARFDYGALIFILTFNLVSVSGYRVDELLKMAHYRVSTIMVGTCLCIIISMLFFPVWAGNQLHNEITTNLEALAHSLQACVEEYFKNMESEGVKKKQTGYKSVLNSKAGQESKANFARWEPAHGQFSFGHPWKQYLKIGGLMRNFAYCVDNLNNCIGTEFQIPELLKCMIEDECMEVSSCCSQVLKEMARVIRDMKKSPNVELLVGEMNTALKQLHCALKPLPKELTDTSLTTDMNGEQAEKKTGGVSLIEALPMAALVALLTETVSRAEGIVDEVNKLVSVVMLKEVKEVKV